MTDEKRQQALILNIRRNSLDDGPGIRTTVFFKGCPLDCRWCHNPESKRARAELSYDAKACVGCGACAERCPDGAVSEANPNFIDREKCGLCFECVEGCPSRAMTRLGTPMTVADVMSSIMKDEAFYKASGGGATFSGGEPTMYMEFCAALMRECRAAGVNTLVETCGMFDYDRFAAMVLPYANSVYIDIKIIDQRLHAEMCGADNERILKNARRLIEGESGGGPEVLPRVPLAPGITDTDENLEAVAVFLKSCGARRVALLSYNPTWLDKLEMLGRATDFPEHTWTSQERLEQCSRFFSDFEIVG